MARRKAKWSEGSVFLVPQSDDMCSVGQVLKLTPEALNSAVCAFSDIRVNPGAGVSADELSADKLISIQLRFLIFATQAFGHWWPSAFQNTSSG
jgi:hypothetical protein